MPDVVEKPRIAGEIENYPNAYGNFDMQLQNFSCLIPEVAERQNVIREGGRELVEQYGVSADFFDDEARSLLFLAIAERKYRSEHEESDQATAAEVQFLQNAMLVIGANYSTKLPQSPHERIGDLTAAEEIAVFEKYTDLELTKQLIQAVQENGLLDGIKQRMQITAANETPYVVRVLNIEGGESAVFGIDKEVLLPRRHAELRRKGDSFSYEIGLKGRTCTAFVRFIEGMPHLCIASPLVEKILYPQITEGNKAYSAQVYLSDKAVLEHEYAHAQGEGAEGLLEGMGIGIAELHAEHFSGNYQGYPDIKMFSLDLEDITGFSMRQFFSEHTKGGTSRDMFIELAHKAGLSGMLDIALVAPGAYQTGIMAEIADYRGGYDGILERLVDRSITQGGVEAAELRINHRVANLYLGKRQMEAAVLGHREDVGLHFLTGIMRDRLRYKRKHPGT